MKYLQPVIGWCYLGVALNVFCVAFMLILVFHQTLAENILVGIVNLADKLFHFKKKEHYLEKIKNSMGKLSKCSRLFPDT